MASKNGTTNYELYEMAKIYRVPIRLNNIIMSDELAKFKPKPVMNFIINLENTDNKGTHWVGLFIRGKKAVYFDSYGAICDVEVIDFCEKHNLKLGYNQYIVQSLTSYNCGLYVFAFLHYMSSNLKNAKNIYAVSNDYVNIFEPSNGNINDKIVVKYLMEQRP